MRQQSSTNRRVVRCDGQLLDAARRTAERRLGLSIKLSDLVNAGLLSIADGDVDALRRLHSRRE